MAQTQGSTTNTYTTPSGAVVLRREQSVAREQALEELALGLDRKRGVLLSSGYEFPGRYTRWDLGFLDPPLCVTGRGRAFELSALNERGRVLLAIAGDALDGLESIEQLERPSEDRLFGSVRQSEGRFPEEQRSRQPSLFSVLRALVAALHSPLDRHLGLYGAFGYDLCFQFEPMALRHPRPESQRDLVLYLPDRLLVVDRQQGRSSQLEYDFSYRGMHTEGLPRTGTDRPFEVRAPGPFESDHGPGEYAAKVAAAKEAFRRGDLFEVVLSQTFTTPCPKPPSAVFRHLERHNPAPFAFLIHLGDDEYLVGASPEMYVRVEGRRVETCPIAGTIVRGSGPLEDATQIRELLNSAKDDAELTMCTDVDRNDKSRICEPGSVKVLGRRQIELYSRLIHTVDHVEGVLRPEFDALDAFLSHAWAVTVTGAPKPGALRHIEQTESSPRAWYGGAVGALGFDGSLNTGLTLRTVRISDARAEVRAGATLLFDSDPETEEQETRIKAAAFLDAVLREPERRAPASSGVGHVGEGLRVLLLDHEDSFVHTLANYLRQTGAHVETERVGSSGADFGSRAPNLVVLSPGPGRPCEFGLSSTIAGTLARGVPLFGVCLGLQGIVEYFGGTLGVLSEPVHGKMSRIVTRPSAMFAGLPGAFVAGRYHSLFADPRSIPDELRVVATTDDGVVMAVEHVSLPIMAVQFHPESILTAGGQVGLKLMGNVIGELGRRGSALVRRGLGPALAV